LDESSTSIYSQFFLHTLRTLLYICLYFKKRLVTFLNVRTREKQFLTLN
jgi:hypothetical protein